MILRHKLFFVGMIISLSTNYIPNYAIAEEHNHQKMEAMDKHSEHNNKPAVDKHAMHRSAMENTGYQVTTENYEIPDVDVIDQSGKTFKLNSLVNSDQPIALNFIFTTCTTICPVMTSTFLKMRKQLGEKGAEVHFISITIDPENDRPDVLKEYAELFGVHSGWTFLTGDNAIIFNVVRSFDAYFGSKMNHQPLTLLKRPDSASWLRIEGLASSSDLTNEVKNRLFN